MISCNGQNISETNEFANSTDLKGKIWHTSIHRYGGSIVENFPPNGNGYNYPTFLFTIGYEVSVRKNVITLKKEDEKFAEFDVNLSTEKIYYPKVYMSQLGLDFTQKK